jgi:signal transduction histidine kinase
VVAEARADIAEAGEAITIEGGLPDVVGNRAALYQVVSNLMTNALKFQRPGTIPRVRLRAELRDGAVRLWVEDTGIGIAPEYHERIFGVFDRLHGSEEYPGTGIGLAIVRRSVERMKGRCGVVSTLGAGSSFWIELPAV